MERIPGVPGYKGQAGFCKLVVEGGRKTPLTVARGVGYEGERFNSLPDRFEVAY